MEEAPENGKESPHSAHANGMNEMNEMMNMSLTSLLLSGLKSVKLPSEPCAFNVCSLAHHQLLHFHMLLFMP